MRIETHADRQQQRLRKDMAMVAAHDRAREAMEAVQAREDGFLRMCEINHLEALERDQAARVIVVPTKAPEPPAVAPVSRIRQKSISFLNGLSIGALITLLIVWLLLLAAGVI